MITKLTEHTMSAGFSTVSLRPEHFAMGHILNVDHFKMSQPTFPPHPHAGFSAVTYMLPWSQGGFINRDSLGDRSRIQPGDLHWTLAASGMMHEEIPENPGTVCEGLQIFVKLPEADELGKPEAFRISAAAMPKATFAGGEARVLVGEYQGVAGNIARQPGTTMLHLTLNCSLDLTLEAGANAFAMVLRGQGTINGQAIQPATALALSGSRAEISGEGFDVLIGMSKPMPRSPQFSGPFCMFDTNRLPEAMQRFRAGKMGALASSF